MSYQESTRRTFPHWRDEPPDGYPFTTEPLNFQEPFIQIRPLPQELQTISEEGKKLLESKNYRNALWKYENCLLIAENMYEVSLGTPDEIVKHASNCALVLLKLYVEIDQYNIIYQQRALEFCKKFCRRCFKLPVERQKLVKVYYRMGETLNFQGDSTEAASFYIKSYKIQPDLVTLSKIIQLNGASNDLFDGFDFEEDLVKLLQLLQSKKIPCKHFIETVKSREEFTTAAKAVPLDVCAPLLRHFSENLLELLNLQESKLVPSIRNFDNFEFFRKFVKNNAGIFTTAEMSRLSKRYRTQYLLVCLQQKNTEQAIELLKSGPINPIEIDLSTVADELLLNEQLLQMLLKYGIDPCGLKGKKSPLYQLASKCPHWPKKKLYREKQKAMLQAIKLLINAGAQVEHLNSYNIGRTTPLHVATELAMATGDPDILTIVNQKWQERPSLLTDINEKTPLHIVADICCKGTVAPSVVDKVWMFLVDECKIDQSALDNIKKKTATSYLPEDIKKRLEISTETISHENVGRADQESETVVQSDTVFITRTNASVEEEITSEVCNDNILKPTVDKDISSETVNEGASDIIKITESAVEVVQEQPIKQVPSVSEITAYQQDIEETKVATNNKNGETQTFEGEKEYPATTKDVLKKLVTQLLSKKLNFQSTEEILLQPEVKQQEHYSTSGAPPKQIKSMGTEVNCQPKVKYDQKETNFDDQIWEVEIHENVAEFTKSRAYPYKIRQQVLKKLCKLASGDWNEKNHKLLSKERNIEIYEIRWTKALRILYQIAIRFSILLTEKLAELNLLLDYKPIHVYTQAIVVWEVVLDHDKVGHSVQRIKKAILSQKHLDENITPVYSVWDESLKRNVHKPQRFVNCPNLEPQLECKIVDQLKSHLTKSMNAREYDVGAKVYSLTTQLALSFLDDESVRKDYPIKATDEEHDIIQLPSSEPVVVLGRSGTGKTTTCLNRLWLNFYNWIGKGNTSLLISEHDLPSSEVIAEPGNDEITVDSTSNAMACADTQNNGGIAPASIEALAAPLNQVLDQVKKNLHQVFITKNHALCVKMKKRFFDFVAGCDITKDHLLVETYSLPERLSQVQHFPIFLTAREFFTMLDKSLDGERFFKPGVRVECSKAEANSHSLNLLFDESDSESDEESEEHENVRQRQRKSREWKEITATEFITDIWPHISSDCSDSKIDPLLIWTEIVSFIKGSAQALSCDDGFISKDEYIQIIGARQSNFSSDLRLEVYKLFVQYTNEMKHKDISVHKFDNCDLVWNLNKRLNSTGLANLSWTIHELHIDEVQDFTEAELSVILRCCKDPNRSFLAGDTAQTIVQGIAFRFEDLKSLFHNFERDHGIVCKVPQIKCLTTNHRSHSSITELANSLIELLKRYFPDAFDWQHIPPDQSNVKGPIPLFICSKYLLDYFLIPPNSGDHSSIEFGAVQVVIARDSSDAGRANMPECLQDEIVLNPQECKGLEFNHVLLYNIFTDTPDQHKDMWKLTTSFLQERFPNAAAKESILADTHPIVFDETHHKSFCTELKMLYTIVTRAKRHIWIYEDSLPKDLPILDYWYKRNLVKVVLKPDDLDKGDDNSSLQVGSLRPEDWKKQGDAFMEKKLWHAARKCYHRANEQSLKNVAYAIALEKKALSTKQADVIQFRSLAARFIINCEASPKKDLVKNAAICLYHAKMYSEAIQLFEFIEEYSHATHICKEHKRSDIDTLVRLTEKRGRHRSAIKLYLQRQKYESALKLAHKYISEGILEQKECYHMLRDVVYNQIKSAVKRKTHTQNKDLVKFVEIIPDALEQAHFLKQAKMYDEACNILERNKSYNSAYRICRAQQFFTKGGKIAESMNDKYKHSMTLLGVEHQLVCFKSTKPSLQGLQTLQKHLESVLVVKSLEPKLKARASLLLSVVYFQRDISEEKDSAMKLCSDAMDIYKKARSKAGEIEAFHMFTTIRVKTGKHSVQHGTKLLNIISKLQKVCALLEKHAATYTTDLSDIEDFYGLEKHGSKVYYIPRQHGYFFQPYSTTGLTDVDGMLQFDKELVLNEIRDHYYKYSESWIKYVENVQESWETKVKLSFPFHTELLRKPFYLQKEHRMFPSEQVCEYLHMCDIALQLSRINHTAFNQTNILDQLIRLLSPFSQLCLPFQQEIYLIIGKSEMLQDLLVKKFRGIVERMFEHIQESPNINTWLQAWRVMGIMNKATIISFETVRQRDWINNLVRTQPGYNPSREPPYSYSYSKSTNIYQSIFGMWELACKNYRERNKALIATRISVVYFIQTIARRRSLNWTFSMENLVHILTIQTTALLAMISGSRFKERKQIVFIVPESFELMTNAFDFVNCSCQQENNYRLLTACFNTSQDLSFQKVSKDSARLLGYILDILSGIYRREYWPLKKAVKEGTETEAVHCLVLTLTLFGNIVVYEFLTPEDCRVIYNSIVSALQSTITFKDTVRRMHETFYKVASTRNTKDLFEGVISTLLKSVGLRLMSLQTVIKLGKPQITIKQCTSRQIPKVDFRWEPYQIPPHLLPRKEYHVSAKESDSIDAPVLKVNTVPESQGDTGPNMANVPAEDDLQPRDSQNLIPDTVELDFIRDNSIENKDHNRDNLTKNNQPDDSRDIESGDEEESEDEDVRKELSAAAVVEVELEAEPEPDPELEKEKKEFLNENRCIICNIESEEVDHHFKSKTHSHQRKLYSSYKNALMTYEFTQKHLVELIKECQEIISTDYELERAVVHAEQLIKSNNEEIANQGDDSNWQNRIDKLEELRDQQTQRVISRLDSQLKKVKQKELVRDMQEAELSEEEKSEEEEKTDDLLKKGIAFRKTRKERIH